MRRCLRDLETAEPHDESESRTGAEDEDAADVCQITIDVRRGGVPVRAFTQPHSLERRANGQDGRLWRVDDRSKVLGAEHAEVRDGQCPALELLLLQVP